jgi:hypothetical protein
VNLLLSQTGVADEILKPGIAAEAVKGGLSFSQ